MKGSPFIYGITVSGHAFTNREQEIARLQSNLLNGINTCILSPRRWGKSSLVEKVIQSISRKEKKIKTVIIDLFAVGSEEEFLELFAREIIKASSSHWQEWINTGKDFFKKLIPKISFGVDPNADFTMSFDWKELKKHSDEVLNLPEVIARKKKVRFIICLDEFQNLSSFKDYPIFEKKMRACWQRQKSVTYCIYGSKRHMMAAIFNNPSKPFYRFGDIMSLPRIETRKWIAYIRKGFAATGKIIDYDNAHLIAAKMQNHSWYVQQLAHYTWNKTKKKVSLVEMNAALDELINANAPLYQKEIEVLSSTQINLLKAVADKEKQLTSAAVMQQFQLGTPNNVSKNKQLLMVNDLIQEAGDSYEFVDPAFELWFLKQYFNRSWKLSSA